MSSTAARLVPVALSKRFEAITEDIMTIRIKHRDKTGIQMQQAGYFAGSERCRSCFAGVLYGI